MSAKFYQRTIKIATGEQITAKFYIASPMDFCIEPTTDSNATNWAKSGAFGTNASFFTVQANKKGYMTALHIFRNKDMSQYPGNTEGGSNNYENLNDTKTAMDVLCCNGTTKKVSLLSKISSWSPSNHHGVNNMEWGVGGFNVLPYNSYANESAFLKAFKEYYPNLYNGRTEVHTPRTAMGVRSDGSVILAALFGNSTSDLNSGPNIYGVHLLMKYFGCTQAICLDGSNCTKISYKSNGSATSAGASTRLTFCRIRLLVDVANSCDWTGQ